MKAFGWLIVFSLCIVSPVYAAIYYVNGACSNCDNANNCMAASNQNTPKQTINAGMTCLNAGDTLYIRQGTYNERLDSLTSGTVFRSGTSWNVPVTIASYPGETATLRPTSGSAAVLELYNGGAYGSTATSAYHQYIIFDGLVFDASLLGGPGSNAVKLDVGSRRIRIQNSILIASTTENVLNGGGLHPYETNCAGGSCVPFIYNTEFEIIRNNIYGSVSGYGVYVSGGFNLFDGNNVYNNAGYAFHLYASNDVAGVHDTIVRNNRMYGNVAGSGSSFVDTARAIIIIGDGHKVYNNIIYNNGGSDGAHMDYGIVCRYCSNSVIYNNTIANNLTTAPSSRGCIQEDQSFGSNIIRNNLCANNTSNNISVEAATQDHNLSTNSPGFTTCSDGTTAYCLSSGSAARDAGADVSSVLTTDIFGNLRQGTFDIGATEFVTGTAVTAQDIRWKMDEGTGSTTADASGNGFTGTLNLSPTWSAGRQGPKSLTFNGSTQFVSNGSYTWPAGQAVTVMMWVRTAGGVEAGAFSVGTSDNPRFGAHIPWSDNRLYWDYGNISASGRISTDYTNYLNKWTHVTLVAAGSANNFKAIYINGQLATSSTSSGSPTIDLVGVTLGKWFQTAGFVFFQPGDLDDFRIYSRMWSAAEILTEYRRNAGSFRHHVVMGR